MVKPISPDEVGAEKQKHLPEIVFETFNRLIAQNFSNGRAKVMQEDVVHALTENCITTSEIDKNGYLNVEEAYRDAGWKVEYDKPGYNESYGAFFVFTKKRS